MSDLEILRRELLERGDEMISFQQLVERFDSVEKEFGNTPWNLKQIYSNFNILIGEKPNKWIPVSERLPENHDDVLVWFEYIKDDYDCAWWGLAYYSLQYKKWVVSTNERNPIVKAWMPLPEPYKASPTRVESEAEENGIN